MKEIIRNIKGRDELSESSRDIRKSSGKAKMVEISAETWKKCGTKTAIFNNFTKKKNYG